jgi:amidase
MMPHYCQRKNTIEERFDDRSNGSGRNSRLRRNGRCFQALVVGLAMVASNAVHAMVELHEANLVEINRAFDTGKLSSVRLVELYLARISAFDKQGPKINAIINLNPKALEEARELDQERAASGARSALHGIPLIIKDTIEVAGMPYTLGHPILADFDPGRDAQVIERLRKAGAVILGKANLTDALGTRGAGESTLGGRTLNPHNAGLTPGGSSGGSAAAVAAWFVPLSLGTDTGGSVLIPAADCGVIGMVATPGIVGGPGHQTRIGPIGRNVYDVAVLLSAMAGWDPLDPTTTAAIGKYSRDGFSRDLDRRPPADFRFGVLRDMFRSDPARADAIPVIEQSIESLRRAGASLVEVQSGLDLFELVKHEHSGSHLFGRWDRRDAVWKRWPPHAPFHSVEELVQLLGRRNIKGTAHMELPPPDLADEYLPRVEVQMRMQAALVRLIEEHRLDALVLPFSLAGPRTWERRALSDMPETALAARVQLPAIVAPAGFLPGDRPIALQFIGAPFSDHKLLQAARLLERVHRVKRQPALTPPLPGERFSH